MFNVFQLTEAINALPENPTELGDSGLFKPRPIRQTTVKVEVKDGVLSLVPATARGTSPNWATSQGRRVISIPVPHLEKNRQLLAEDIQDLRAFGSDQLTGKTQAVNDALEELRLDIDVTKEYHRIGAVQGQILDADGTTVLVDLFDAFGVTEQAVAFHLNVATTKVKAIINDCVRKVRKALGNAKARQIVAYCGDDFFDALTSHDEVRETFLRYKESSVLRSDYITGFEYGGVVWKNYTGEVSGNTFMPTGECRFVPHGVPKLFATDYAPADYTEAVNTLGKPYYAKMEDLPMNKGWHLQAQSNPLMLCTRPGCLVKGRQTT